LPQCSSSGTRPRAGVPGANAASDSISPRGEVRIQAIGETGSDVLFVVYTDRGDARHIISARLANRKERRAWQSFAAQWKESDG
jgi:uncharacterized DUF497 family protein